MWLKMAAIFTFALLCGLFRFGHAVELTFELPDSAKECFYELIDEGTQSTVEFQVNCLRIALILLSYIIIESLFLFKNDK